MHEPLTSHLVAEMIAELALHFPGKRAAQDTRRLAEGYRNALSGISGEGLRHAVRRAIQEDTYFPKVSRLRELATGYETYQRNTQRQERQTDEDVCQSCGTRYYFDQNRWRPLVGQHPNGEPDYRAWLASDDGQWLLLAPYGRVVCRCMPASAFMPAEGTEPPAARLWANAKLPMPTKRTDTVVTQTVGDECR